MNQQDKIFVTGGSGFIGFALVEELIRLGFAEHVICLVRSPEKQKKLKALSIKTILGDLNDAESYQRELKQARYVFHLAAQVPFQHGRQSFHELTRNNVLATDVLLRHCPGDLKRFVFMSSVNAVERASGDACVKPLDEESFCSPRTAYGKTKLQSELKVKEFCAQNSIPYLILRPPSIVYGAGCNPDSGMNKLIQGVEKKSLMMSLNFPGHFSMIHVRDLARETVRMAFQENLQNKVYFVGEERPKSLPQITSEIVYQLHSDFQLRQLPVWCYFLLNNFVLFVERIPLVRKLIPIQLQILLRDYSVVNSDKAREEACFETHLSLRDGIAEMAAQNKQGVAHG